MQTFLKWMFGLSLTLLILSVPFVLFLWSMANAAGALLLTLIGAPGELSVISFPQFMENFLFSPMFYICLTEILVLVLSIIGLRIIRKKSQTPEVHHES